MGRTFVGEIQMTRKVTSKWPVLSQSFRSKSMGEELKCFGFTSEDGKTHNSKDLGDEWKLKWTSIESTKSGKHYFNEMLFYV
jgi:hypothetical protein